MSVYVKYDYACIYCAVNFILNRHFFSLYDECSQKIISYTANKEDPTRTNSRKFYEDMNMLHKIYLKKYILFLKNLTRN